MKSPLRKFFTTLVLINFFLFGLTNQVVVAESNSQSGQPADFLPGQVVVGLAENASLSDLTLFRNAVPDLAESTSLADLNVVVLDVQPGKEIDTALALQRQPEVVFAEPNYLLQADLIPNDTNWTVQYAPQNVNAPAAWDITTGNSNVVLAILDSGIDLTHTEFAGRLLPGYDFVENDNIPQDNDGHGTHVTGIAAATGNNNQGIAGIDWQTRILPVRILNNFGSGTTVNFAKGILFAIDNHADVINMSLGTSVNSRLLEYSTYYAYQKGVALVASSGNNNAPVSYPAAYPWVLAVGATDLMDQRWASSNYGPQLDLVAPGVGIYSTGLSNSYFYQTGTSMSAPLVAGTAALLAGLEGFTTPERIYAAITNSASQYPTRDNNLGYGILRVDAALAFDPTSIPLPPASSAEVDYDSLRSAKCANIPLQWRDIPDLETAYSPALGVGKVTFTGNYSLLEFPSDFQFSFANIDYTQLYISADGWLGFDGPYSTLFNEIEGRNDPIPTKDNGAPYDRPDWLIAPFWDDLDALASESVYAAVLGSSPNREIVIEWQSVPLAAFPTSSELTFQAILEESSGEIIFNYLNLSGNGSDGSSATIGLEYNNGESGVQIGYNQANTVRPGESIVFVPYDPSQSSRSAKGCLYSANSGPAGGFYDFSPFCLDVPSGLLQENSTITFELLADVNSEKSSTAIGQYAQLDFDPKPTSPYNPMPMLCYQYSSSDLARAGGNPSNFYLARYSNEGWVKLTTLVQSSPGRILSPIISEGIYGVFAISAPEKLPVTGAGYQTQLILILISTIIGGMAIIVWRAKE